MNATGWQPYRPKIFLGLIFILYLWDVAFFLGIRDPARIPHPFAAFDTLGDIVFLRGFTSMLREIIFMFVSGGLVGIGIGAMLLRAPSLTAVTLRLLRIALWAPLILAYVIYAPLFWGIVTAMLCAAYHYPAARSILNIRPGEALTWAAREVLLQTLLFSLISQIWVDHWRWFDFSVLQKPETAWARFAVLAVSVALVNWCFRSSFTTAASNHAYLQASDVQSPRGLLRLEPEGCLIVFFTIALLAGWLISLSDVPIAVFNLLAEREIWGDMWFSSLEIFAGLTLACLISLGLLLLPTQTSLISLLPVTHISAMVLWTIIFGMGTAALLPFWHKVILVGCLTFFPCFETLWATQEQRPLIDRLLKAIHAALPFAFVAMVFGEAMAATRGLGFSIIVAAATRQADKALAVFFFTLVLLGGLLSFSKAVIRKLDASPPTPGIATS